MPETVANHPAPREDARLAQAHALWDGLADFDAARIDDALDYLMRGLCALAGARNAGWTGVVRLANAGGDPTGGWRPLVMRFLHPTEKLLAAISAETQRMDLRFPNEAAAGVMVQAGRFRACRLCDVVPGEWFASDAYRAYYSECDRDDAVYVAFPLNADAESYFSFFRDHDQPAFATEERDALAYALRGIKWFHRKLMLSHGLLVAGTPLTETERRVLQGLLGGQTEKQIAAELGQSPHTTHGHVTSIYRKFGVRNRPALTALWLGTGRSTSRTLTP